MDIGRDQGIFNAICILIFLSYERLHPRRSTPPEAAVLAARLYAMLPRIRITDPLAEVASWTLFPDCFTHLRTGEMAADNRILMAGLLAMAEPVASPASANSPGRRTGTSARRPMPWHSDAWSTSSSASRSR